MVNQSFRQALLWHMERHKTLGTELARAAGVSLNIIKKLRTREMSSTSAEVATKIAAYYGKDLATFLRCSDDVPEADQLTGLISLLNEEERRLFAAQIRGFLAARAQQ